MNLIKGAMQTSQVVHYSDSQEKHAARIEKWKCLYAGHLKEIHTVKIPTSSNPNKTRKMLTLNIPKLVSNKLARLIFNEKCEISYSDIKYGERIDELLNKHHFDREFQKHLEYGLALGGLVAKVYADDGELKYTFVNADSFVITDWDQYGITGAVFLDQTYKNGEYYTLFESHQLNRRKRAYTVSNRLYKSKTSNEIGVEVPLNEIYSDLERDITFNKVDKPFFAYFKPNTANNIDLNSPFGISVYANAIDACKATDEAFDSFNREIRLGKKRIIAPVQALKTSTDINGDTTQYFDVEDEVFVFMKLGLDAEGEQIKDVTSELRIQEHIDAVNAGLQHISMLVGLSPGTFTFTATGLKTATEVISENDETFKTKQSHEIMVEEFIKDLIHAIITLGGIVEPQTFTKPPQDFSVTITFDDSIAESKETKLNNIVTQVTNGFMSKLEAIMELRGLEEKEAVQVLEQIQKENRTITPDMTEMMGGE
ncbi:phage portal protein [Bacillus thuringiensis]|uniref:phage portal protein n=1 Tax=Bacillus thuringiensis TaxID=1428 RepID=UPI0015D4884F|nr:phage portal protein [Bacillus thuringiensis]